jgi:hypothetical protein
MFFRALTRTFWLFYDNLFKGVLLNLILFGLCLTLFVIFFIKLKYMALALILIFLLFHLISPAYMHYFGKIARQEENKGVFREVLEGLRLFALRGAAVYALNLGFFYVAWLAVGFYRRMGNLKTLNLALGGIGIWLVIVFLLMQLYIMPIMVLDEKRRIFTSYRKALIMLLSQPFASSTTGFLIGYFMLMLYPMLSFVFGAQIPTLLALTALFPIFLMPFLSLLMITLLQLNSTLLVYEKHGVYPSLKEVWEDRTLGNIFKPWDQK